MWAFSLFNSDGASVIGVADEVDPNLPHLTSPSPRFTLIPSSGSF